MRGFFKFWRRREYKRGQNTAEYVVMLVLVAVGGISMASIFGSTLKKQFRNAVAGLGGGDSVIDSKAEIGQADAVLGRGTGMKLQDEEIQRVTFGTDAKAEKK